jgi:hypothetical protein
LPSTGACCPRWSTAGPRAGSGPSGTVGAGASVPRPEFDDRPTLALYTGDPFPIPTGVIHNARNVGTVTTKMLSTYFVDETRPLVTPY